MNSIGRIFRLNIFGESHGECVGILMDGIPPGIPIRVEDFTNDIQRRKPGTSGTTTRLEEDLPIIKSGVFNDFTSGAPILIEFQNSNKRSSVYSTVINQPRPGHSDFVAHKKFKGYNDYRGGGHFSGRLTLPIVAAGVVAKKIFSDLIIQTKILEIGGNENVDAALQNAIENQDSIGGIIECRVTGIPIGIGEPFFDSIESVLSHLIFSIPAVKGIEFGSGFSAAKMKGSEHNDVFINEEGTTKTNNSGGISGGLSNGNELVLRIAIKPTSSTPSQQESFNLQTSQMEKFKIEGRHDLCIALRVPV
ncbi:MAG: chorismate synthase, partial [Saprospiraceae bacterium]|nr:chorismate synthase [Saprospiraceae bacterium]